MWPMLAIFATNKHPLEGTISLHLFLCVAILLSFFLSFPLRHFLYKLEFGLPGKLYMYSLNSYPIYFVCLKQNIRRFLFSDRGTRWLSRLRHCATSRKVTSPIPYGVIGISVGLILPAPLWPWDWLTLTRTEYHEYFLGVKAAGA